MNNPLFIPLEHFLFFGEDFNNPNLNILNQIGNLDFQNNNYHLVILTDKNEERNNEINNMLQVYNIFPDTIINNINGLNTRLLSPMLQQIENRFYRNEILYIRDNDINIINRL